MFLNSYLWNFIAYSSSLNYLKNWGEKFLEAFISEKELEWHINDYTEPETTASQFHGHRQLHTLNAVLTLSM